jgi:hypothetical protein
MKDYLIIDHVQGGQPRPYADSVYSAYISKRREEMLLNGRNLYIELDEQVVKGLARLCVRDFEDEPKNWASARLVECKAVGPTDEMKKEIGEGPWTPGTNTRWFVRIVEPYTD